MKLVLKVFLVFSLFLLIAPRSSQADAYVYKEKINAANYVRLKKIKERQAEERVLNHPYSIDMQAMAHILRSLRYSKRSLISKQAKIKQIFLDESIEKYAPHMVEALKKADPFQVGILSMAQKRPLVVLRNDSLTIVEFWVQGSELYLKFLKTEAQLKGDYKGFGHRASNLRSMAKGLRLELEPQIGQRFGESTKEIVVDLKQDWQKLSQGIVAGEQSQKLIQPLPAKQHGLVDQKSAEERLLKLKRLKEKGLISTQDYERKKQEILGDL